MTWFRRVPDFGIDLTGTVVDLVLKTDAFPRDQPAEPPLLRAHSKPLARTP
ncbi:hypothetical protein [Streptomyces sp. NPDC048720]|uniref:hypothetical protein n=1 Tax=Streptomyces sp. NPDC048720 TaxID=3365588 RepID=UPI00371D0EAA